MARGRTKQEQEAIDRYWKGMEVIEAKHALWIFPQKRDRRGAVKGDPEHCVLAQASQRQYSSTAVVILRTRAYIDLEDEDGVRKVFRFLLPETTRRKIRHYDQTGGWLPGGLRFDPPTASQTLEAQRGREAKRASTIKGKAKAKPKAKSKKPNPRSNALTANGVRDGHGMVHFKKEK